MSETYFFFLWPYVLELNSNTILKVMAGTKMVARLNLTESTNNKMCSYKMFHNIKLDTFHPLLFFSKWVHPPKQQHFPSQVYTYSHFKCEHILCISSMYQILIIYTNPRPGKIYKKAPCLVKILWFGGQKMEKRSKYLIINVC